MNRSLVSHSAGLAVFVVMALLTGAAAQGAITTIDSRFAEVNGIKLHYLIAGKGAPVLLLHGYAQNSHMWRPLMAELGKTHTVIAPDLRGFGQSDKPESGYDKRRMARTSTPWRPRWARKRSALSATISG